MGWLGWIILGGLAGWVAGMIMKEEGGVIKNIILGIIGGLLGGGVVQLLGGAGITGFNLYSFLVAVLGAIVVVYLARLLTGKKA